MESVAAEIAIQLGMFWATVAVALITVTAAAISYFFFRSQTDPDVLLYVEHDFRRPSLLTLVIENVGARMAYDVRFSPSRPLVGHAPGIEKPTGSPRPMESGPIVTGIPNLAPGGRRVLNWGQIGGLRAVIGESPIRVTVRFGASRWISWLPRRSLRNDFLIEVESYDATDASDSNWDKKISGNIEKLERTVGNLANEVAGIRRAMEGRDGSPN